MILTCPSCGTQYVVKDGAIPPEGRQVRCAACKHSWHQGPESDAANAVVDDAHAEAEPVEEAPPAAPEAEQSASDEDESLAEATLIEPRSGPEVEERAYEEAVIEGAVDPEPAPAAMDDAREPEQSVL
ncbi:MAG: hypothetical protein QOE50_1445, partial [Sphingomonadales bacterium]|nr:hypothetical protein [Sphingomonadales bacterium]